MKKRQIKEPIRLREKELKGGNKSLYLDIYFQGKRSYEFLKLYIITKPKSEQEKRQNRETYQLANSIKSQKILEMQHSKHGFINRGKGKTEFIPYFLKLIENKKGTTKENWLTTCKHLKNFAGNDTFTFNDIDKEFVAGFRDYLLNEPITKGRNKLAINTAAGYFTKFNAGLNKAKFEGLIQDNPADRVERIKMMETKREFLTLSELKTLAKTECKLPLFKKAFLFSALTGLRWSDIEKLTWSEVRQDDEKYYLVFQQKKTAGREWLPISKQARDMLGEPGKPDEQVFEGARYSAWHNVRLKEWFLDAGIRKDITFHSARHSFATLMLSQGVDIYTVSKLLGHKELQTTQIYAKVLDKQKEDAVNRMPDINFDEDE